jgi:hypothetical protein
MGGAVVVHVASRRLVPRVRGVAVVDVVEGTPSCTQPSMHADMGHREAHRRASCRCPDGLERGRAYVGTHAIRHV